jgi:predicted RNA binding protein YcfA (HicA-like mRNA interferase family)
LSHDPALNGKDLLQALKRLGFKTIRIRGSHHFVRHADGRSSVIPVHANETLGPGLMKSILRQIKLTRADINRVL